MQTWHTLCELCESDLLRKGHASVEYFCELPDVDSEEEGPMAVNLEEEGALPT